MQFWNWLKGRYASHPEAVIISCYFNPQRSPYRRKAFDLFYESIRHLNHRVVECIIGDDSPQLPESAYIERVHTPTLLWHKEGLLNALVRKLPPYFRYVFWLDADVLFTNRHWLTEAVEKLASTANIVQPFEYCFHLDKDQVKPDFDVDYTRERMIMSGYRNPRMWRSFAANYVTNRAISEARNYDRHGHVGFAWGARREILELCPLYDRALIGGADHIIAHAAARQLRHPCIENAFADDIDAVRQWSERFDHVVGGKLSFVPGDLYHIWHGDIDKRKYLQRVKEFTLPSRGIQKRDPNGLYVATDRDQEYVKRYFASREVAPRSGDDGFLQSMLLGYWTDSTIAGTLVGGHLPGAMLGQLMRDSQESHHHERQGAEAIAPILGPEPQTLPAATEPIVDTGNFSDQNITGGDFDNGENGNFS